MADMAGAFPCIMRRDRSEKRGYLPSGGWLRCFWRSVATHITSKSGIRPCRGAEALGYGMQSPPARAIPE